MKPFTTDPQVMRTWVQTINDRYVASNDAVASALLTRVVQLLDRYIAGDRDYARFERELVQIQEDAKTTEEINVRG